MSTTYFVIGLTQRVTRFERATCTLARCRSTTELYPHTRTKFFKTYVKNNVLKVLNFRELNQKPCFFYQTCLVTVFLFRIILVYSSDFCKFPGQHVFNKKLLARNPSKKTDRFLFQVQFF